MKVLVNGGLNLSEMDGWWAEAYMPDVGWSLGDGQEHGDDPEWDAAEADALYERLENEVIPEFYARATDGVPAAWLARVRESMARLTPRFSATRAVRDYTEQRYIPAAIAYRSRADESSAEAQRLVERQKDWEARRRAISFGEVSVVTSDVQHAITAEVFLGTIKPDAVRVELYADADRSQPAQCSKMTLAQTAESAVEKYRYLGTASTDRPAAAYTVRITSAANGLNAPLEESWVLWHK